MFLATLLYSLSLVSVHWECNVLCSTTDENFEDGTDINFSDQPIQEVQYIRKPFLSIILNYSSYFILMSDQ
jgi:hypothetical protein